MSATKFHTHTGQRAGLFGQVTRLVKLWIYIREGIWLEPLHGSPILCKWSRASPSFQISATKRRQLSDVNENNQKYTIKSAILGMFYYFQNLSAIPSSYISVPVVEIIQGVRDRGIQKYMHIF